MIELSLKSLRIIRLVWPTRLVVLAMGEVLSFEFDLAVSLPSDRRGDTSPSYLLFQTLLPLFWTLTCMI